MDPQKIWPASLRKNPAAKNDYAPSALMGAGAERACRLQERRSLFCGAQRLASEASDYSSSGGGGNSAGGPPGPPRRNAGPPVFTVKSAGTVNRLAAGSVLWILLTV